MTRLEQLYNAGVKQADSFSASVDESKVFVPLVTERGTAKFLQHYMWEVFGWETGVKADSFVRISGADFEDLNRFQIHPDIVSHVEQHGTMDSPKPFHVDLPSAFCVVVLGSGSEESRYICTVGEPRREYLKNHTRNILGYMDRNGIGGIDNHTRQYVMKYHPAALYHLEGIHETVHYDATTLAFEIGSYLPFQDIARFTMGVSIANDFREHGVPNHLEEGLNMERRFASEIERCVVQFEGSRVGVLLDGHLIGSFGYQLTESIIDFITVGAASKFAEIYLDFFDIRRKLKIKLDTGDILIVDTQQQDLLEEILTADARTEVGSTLNVEEERLGQSVVVNFLQMLGISTPAEAMHLMGTFPPILKFLLKFGSNRFLDIPSSIPLEISRFVFGNM